MKIRLKNKEELSLFNIVWREASKHILILAALFTFFVIFSYLFALGAYKSGNLAEKTNIMVRTIDKAIEVSDWDMALQYMSTNIESGGLYSAQLSSLQGDIIIGPLKYMGLSFLPVCKSANLPKHNQILLRACVPIIMINEIVIFILIIFFVAGFVLFSRYLFNKSNHEIISMLSSHINQMRSALKGSLKNERENDAEAFIETKELVREIELLVKEVKVSQADRARAELVSQVVHDIRSPITAFKAARRSVGAQAHAPACELMDSAIFRMEKMCNDLLATYRNPTHCVPTIYEASLVNIEKAIEALVRDRKLSISVGSNVEIKYLHKVCPALLNMNELTVERIIDNILGNSIQAVDQNTGKITVELNSDIKNKCALISVTDNGKGIEEQDIPLIFDKSFTKNKMNGTGIGLYFVKNEVEKAGGKIKVSSRCMAGTRFEICLPIVPLASNEAQTNA